MSSSVETLRSRQQIKQWTSANGSICQRRPSEKDELLFRCYNLLQKLEKGYVGDCPENDHFPSQKYDWQLEFDGLNQVFTEMGAVISEKISQAEKLKNTSENLLMMLDNLSENFQFVVSETAAEKEKLLQKQMLLDEMKRDLETKLENSANSVSTGTQIYDNLRSSGGTGDSESPASLQKLRLDFIADSYVTLAKELVTEEQLPQFRDFKILELKRHVTSAGPQEIPSLSNHKSLETPEEGSTSSSTTSMTSTNTTVIGKRANKTQELLRLVKRLQAKLAKKKEHEKVMKEEKEMLYHMAKIIAKINGSSGKTHLNLDLQVSPSGMSFDLLSRSKIEAAASSDICDASNPSTLEDTSDQRRRSRKNPPSHGLKDQEDNPDRALRVISRVLSSIMETERVEKGAIASSSDQQHESVHAQTFMKPERERGPGTESKKSEENADEDERKLVKLNAIVQRFEADFNETRQELRKLKSIQAELTQSSLTIGVGKVHD